jgi:aldehyde dehydrogenase (NAD+)
VARLRQTFDSGKTRPIEWRQAQLFELGRMMRQHEADFAEALRLDLGKCLFEAVLTEMSFVEAEAKYASKHLADWMRPRRVPTPMMLQPGRSYVQPEPKGVALIIAPWNYPLSMVLAPLVGAIAGGNCVVMKPSEVTANVSAAIASILPRYLDGDAFAIVEGGVPETTELLEQRFDHILYTGNERVARIVMTAAAKHLTPVTLELGGKSPCLVDKSADLEVAASRIAWGKFINAGQTCVAPDHVLVHRDVSAQFIDLLAGKIKEFYGDDPSQSPDFCRIASERHVARFQ